MTPQLEVWLLRPLHRCLGRPAQWFEYLQWLSWRGAYCVRAGYTWNGLVHLRNHQVRYLDAVLILLVSNQRHWAIINLKIDKPGDVLSSSHDQRQIWLRFPRVPLWCSPCRLCHAAPPRRRYPALQRCQHTHPPTFCTYSKQLWIARRTFQDFLVIISSAFRRSYLSDMATCSSMDDPVLVFQFPEIDVLLFIN